MPHMRATARSSKCQVSEGHTSAAAGPRGAALAPPKYGIDLADRTSADEDPFQIMRPQSLFTSQPLVQFRSAPTSSQNTSVLPGNLKFSPESRARFDMSVVQRKLSIGASHDPLEQEADRVADHVLTTPAHPFTSSAPPRIQRFSGQSNGQMDAAPASVDQALASPGRPLDPALQQDMGQRFGHDFSRVRVHSDGAAEQSAREVNATAYTVGHDIVFSAGRFTPATHEGRRLIAHELTHVVQQDPSSRGRATSTCVQRFESHEHVQLGDTAGGSGTGFILLECYSRDLPQHASPTVDWPLPWQIYYRTLDPNQQRALMRGLTYGEIVALIGDMYKDFQALNRAPLKEVIDLIPLIRSKSTTTQDYQAATGGRYLALAKENIGHFSNVPSGQRNRDIWRRNHIDAIAAAQMGNASLAWGLNAAGDHFLTDAFSGGHLRVQRSSLHAQGTVGDAKSKVLHDLDNEFGVQVTNDRGDPPRGDPPWITYGDEHLNDAANTYSLKVALEAVQLSKQDIADALAQGASYPSPIAATVFPAERLIPHPMSMTANRWTPHDMMRELGHLATSEVPGIASDLVGDDNRVRSWINRMDRIALSRQSETDVGRMLTVLLSLSVTSVSLSVTDDDMSAIERLLGSVTDATVMSRLRTTFRHGAIKLQDFGLRARFRIALDRNP